jgi:hypothetical protein
MVYRRFFDFMVSRSIWRQVSTVKTGHKPDIFQAVSRSIRRRVSFPVASLKSGSTTPSKCLGQ